MAPLTLEECLSRFDSHERGILLQWATGQKFRLGEAWRKALHQELSIGVPAEAFVAMDYTLDWLYAAMRCYADPSLWEGGWQSRGKGGTIAASQEDIDLVVAWEDREGPHLLLIEAKAFTGWTNRQLESKAKRLRVIFEDPAFEGIAAAFVLVGPKYSEGLRTGDWPELMQRDGRFHFLEIPAEQRWYITRNVGSESWSKWRVKARRWAGAQKSGVRL